MKSKPKKRYFTGIDGLRALAVIGVILYHVNPNQFVGGYLGVLIFFILSGYFITGHIIKKIKSDSFNFKEFYIKRIKRIYPQLVSVLSLTSVYILLFQRDLLHNLYQIVISNLLGIYNFWQIFNGQSYFERFAQDESPFIHLWTLSIEWQFYVIWPIVLVIGYGLLKKTRYMAVITVILTALSAGLMAYLFHPGIDTSRIYYGTDTRLFALMIGSLLAMILPSEKLSVTIPKQSKWLINGLGAISLIALCLMSIWPEMNPQNSLPYLGGMLGFSLITALLVAVIIHPAASFNRLLTNPVFSYLGSRSYGIYLYQFPVMIFFESSFKQAVHHPRLVPIIEIIIILIISEISYQLIEKHVNTISFKNFKNVIANFKTLRLPSQVKWLTCAAIMALFMASVGVSPFAKEKVNPNPLEQAVTDNVKQNKKHNENILAKNNRLNKQTAKVAFLDATKKAEGNQTNIDESYFNFGLTKQELAQLHYLPVTAVGDSVMAGSSNGLRDVLPNMTIDAAISRQMVEGYDILKRYQDDGNLSPIILTGLGTNGPFTQDDLEKVIQLVDHKSHIFWINVHVPNRPWQSNVNSTLADFATSHSANFTVIDWYDYSNAHSDWFIDDMTHLNPLGSGPKYYGAYVAKTILDTMSEQNT